MEIAEFDAMIAEVRPYNRRELSDLFETLLPDSIPALTKATLLMGLNAVPKNALPEISGLLRKMIGLARDQGPEAVVTFLQELGCPPELLDMVRAHAPAVISVRAGDSGYAHDTD
jgi:hypothetical protein